MTLPKKKKALKKDAKKVKVVFKEIHGEEARKKYETLNKKKK